LSLGNIDEVEDDGLIVSKHITMSDSEKKRVADLSGSSSDSNSNWLLGLGLDGKIDTKVAKADLDNSFISTLFILNFQDIIDTFI